MKGTILDVHEGRAAGFRVLWKNNPTSKTFPWRAWTQDTVLRRCLYLLVPPDIQQAQISVSKGTNKRNVGDEELYDVLAATEDINSSKRKCN